MGAKPPGENNWWVAKLYTAEFTRQIAPIRSRHAGSRRRDLHTVLTTEHGLRSLHGLQIAVPRWSPDGKQIAFIGGLMCDQGSTGGDVYVVPCDRRRARGCHPESPERPPTKSGDNDHSLGFIEDRRGTATSPLSTGTTEKKDPVLTVPSLGEVQSGGGPIKDAVSSSTPDGDSLRPQSLRASAPEVWTRTLTV